MESYLKYSQIFFPHAHIPQAKVNIKNG